MEEKHLGIVLCQSCDRYKNLEDIKFMNNSYICNDCFKIKEDILNYKKKKSTKSVYYRNYDKYGINEEIYNDLFNKQNGCCAICNKHQNELNRSLCIDHNHTTGKVRGLLCGKCNASLGLMNENEDNILNMITYLREYSKFNC